MRGRTICPREDGVPLNFKAVNVVSYNVLGAADGLTILLRNCTVDQATVDLAAISCNDNDQRREFWSVGAAVAPAILVSRDVGDECPF